MEDPWFLVDKYFGSDKGRVMVKHLLESYNEFLMKNMHDIIEGFNTIEINHTFLPDDNCFKFMVAIDIKNPVMTKPIICEKDGSTKVMTPLDARNRNFTYAGSLYVDINVNTSVFNEETKTYAEETKKIVNVCIGKIPIMVKSKYCVLNDMSYADKTGECKYDHGGYMIVNGNEKVIVSQNRVPENKPHVFPSSKVTAYSHTVEIRSVKENQFSVPKTTTLKLSAKPSQFGHYIRVNIHYVKQDLPVAILFRALGVESDLDIVKHVFFTEDDPLIDMLEGTLEEGNHIMCQRDAFEYLARHMNINEYPREIASAIVKAKKLEIVKNVLINEFMPHVGASFSQKALYLGYMINKLLKVSIGILPYDDRDSYVNKRIDTPGILMANLFRQYYGKMIKDMKNMINKEINNGSWKANNQFGNLINKVNVTKIVKSNIIESGLKYGLATGNWGIKSNKTKAGVAQVANRHNPHATLSHLKRINTPVDKTVGKLVLPRKLHSTQFGIICPAETPEGASVGLVKNMSMISGITTSANSSSVHESLDQLGIDRFDGTNLDIFANDATKVIVNGNILGVHPAPAEFFFQIKDLKRRGIINVYTAITWKVYLGEIWICTEGGRFVRPLIIVDPGNVSCFGPEQRAIVEANKLPWSDCVAGNENYGLKPIIEFLDVDEANSSIIAMQQTDLTKGSKGFSHTVRYTHLELHASLMLGVLAGSIPFSNHNQAPRNCYQCLAHDEPVLMADGTKMAIEHVKIGDEVMTFDPATGKVARTVVVNQFVRPTDKPIFSITTFSGHTIKATFDHKFFTNEGWKEVQHFEVGVTSVAILSDEMTLEIPHVRDMLGDLLFEPVHTVTAIPNCLIADITVASEHHCFFGGQGFAVHNSAMGKQAIGRYTSNFDKRYDTIGNILDYAQKPIIQTRIGKLVNNDELPSGMNITVAIMVMSGYNQEDSVMLCNDAVERGMFSSTGYNTYKEQNNKNFSTGEEEMFCKPDPATTKSLKPFNYDKLDADGFVPLNTYVESGDVIIGKCMPQKNGSTITYKDTSVALKNNQSGYIDKIYRDQDGNIATNGDGFSFTKVCIRSPKTPCIGDKFCVPGDTEVYMDGKGWVRIDAVQKGDLIMQLDPETKGACYAPIMNTVKYDGGDAFEMIKVEGDAINLLVTPEHKMVVVAAASINLVMAKDLEGTERYFKGASAIHLPYVMVYPYDWIDAKDLAYMFGLYAVSGSLADNIMTFARTDTSLRIIDALNVSNVMNVANGPAVMISSGNKLFHFLKHAQNIMNCEQWIIANAANATACMSGLIDGLSEEKRLGGHPLGPFSPGLADDVQMIAMAAGLCADVLQGDFVTLRENTLVEASEYTLSRTTFQGPVYCVEVPSHIFLARRGGKCIWTGNSSRHGQKGTVGMMYAQQDMPWMRDGTVPDMIINPHAIPSRMTIAQLMECLMGKACCAMGTYGDATPFTDLTVEDIAKELQGCGLERYGNEIMYNSRTGEQIQTAIFCGPTYYQRLKHMVADKVHSRANNGPVVLLTRQPAEGRARDGGLRLGEMEVGCNLTLGIGGFLKERFIDCSDNYRIFVCKKCGMMANVNPEANIYVCKPCNNTTMFSELRIPYAAKLLFQEIQTMSIGTRFIT